MLFLFFFKEIGFDISCKLETIYMKWQCLFTVKNKKNIKGKG